MPPPVEIGDVLELGRGPMLIFRIVDVVEAGPQSSVAALVKAAPAPAVAYALGPACGSLIRLLPAATLREGISRRFRWQTPASLGGST